MGTLLNDVRYGFRMLVKNPGFTAVAVLTLALGIGANTAIFSVVNTLLLQPLRYQDPDRLMLLWESNTNAPISPVAYPDFLDWQAQSTAFSEMSAFHWTDFNLTGRGSPADISAAEVSQNFFTTLGIRPVRGRDFTASDSQANSKPVALISYRLWQQRFAGRAQAVGENLTLDGRDYTVVGVLPPFLKMYITDPDIYLPIGLWASKMQVRGEASDTAVIARLKPGTTMAQARAQMSAIASRLAEQYPGTNAGTRAELQPMKEFLVGDIRPAVLILFGAVGFVLLIASANVANLLLARATTREREIAIRSALGAGRKRVFRQLLTESVLLGAFGGGFGLLLGIWGVGGISSLIPADYRSLVDLRIDRVVLLFAAVVSLVTGVVFGVAPALRASKCELARTLQEGGRGSAGGRGGRRFRKGLVIFETALALVLVTSAGLMIRSLHRLLTVDPGFNPERVLTLSLSLRGPNYATEAQGRAFWQRSVEQVQSLAGVRSAALGTNLPLTGDHSITSLLIEGRPAPQPGHKPTADYHLISSDYLRVMNIPLVKGRAFNAGDDASSPPVALISGNMARRYWPKQDPIGVQFKIHDKDPWRTVVGVVGDTRQYGLSAASQAEFYLPYLQNMGRSMNLVVRTAGDPLALAHAVDGRIHSIDPDEPITDVKSMEQIVSDSVVTERVTRLLLGLMAALAVLLAAVGLYGVMSYSAARRTREIGIRMAFGAEKGQILRVAIREGAELALIGVVAGLGAAWLFTRALASLLYGVRPADPVTYAVASAVMVTIALLAAYVPARRATKVDPMVALRHE